MSIQKVRELFAQAGYVPHLPKTTLQERNLFGALSDVARAFVREATGRFDQSSGKFSLPDLFDKIWYQDQFLMDFFLNVLDSDEQAEVLGFFTLLLHEMTHHVDYTTTPFGVNFHLKLFEEYICFGAVAPALLEMPDLLPIGRFADFSHEFPAKARQLSEQESMAHPLFNKIMILEAWGDGGANQPHGRRIERGWIGVSVGNTIDLLGQTLSPCTVSGFLHTVSVPGRDNWYLRPLTIFETRAMVHSLLWVRQVMGNHKQLGQVMRSYLNAYYGQEHQLPDYLFIPDLMARSLGYRDFDDLLLKSEATGIDFILKTLSGACWYALHAPPPKDDYSLAVSSPIIRLLYALTKMRSEMMEAATGGNPLKYPSLPAYLLTLDHPTQGQNRCGADIEGILQYCDELLSKQRENNLQLAEDPALRNHFELVLGLLQRQIRRRQGSGYACKVGLPPSGNALMGMDDPRSHELLDHYECTVDDQVQHWFSFRAKFLWTFMRQELAVDGLDAHFGTRNLMVFCPCGIALSATVSRFWEGGEITCPNCNCSHYVDPRRTTPADLSAESRPPPEIGA